MPSSSISTACWWIANRCISSAGARCCRPSASALEWEIYHARFIGISDLAMLEDLARLRQPPLDVDLLWQQYPRKRALFRERMLERLACYRRSARSAGIARRAAPGRGQFERPRRDRADSHSGWDPRIFRRAGLPRGCHRVQARARALLESGGTAAGDECPLVVEDSQAGIASGKAAGFDVLEIPAAARMPELLRERIGR